MIKDNESSPVVFLSPSKEKTARTQWKNSLCKEKKHRWSCSFSNICVNDLNIKKNESLSKLNSINVHSHHIYGVEDFPQLRHNSSNGILLYSAIHVEYHRFHNVRFKKKPITKASFLLFCSSLQKDLNYTHMLLTKIFESLNFYFCLNQLSNYSTCFHPKSQELCFQIFLDGSQNAGTRVVLFPIKLIECYLERKYVYFLDNIVATEQHIKNTLV